MLVVEPTDRTKGHEDFLNTENPDSTTKRYKIGYNPGHIRSILKLDTYGPHHSSKVAGMRDDGSLPSSPNTDRNRSALTGTVRSLSPSSSMAGSRPVSPESSATFGTRHTNNSNRGLRKNKLDQYIPTGNRQPTLTEKYGSALGELNARTKGREWFSTYKAIKHDRKTEKQDIREFRAFRSTVHREAVEIANTLDEFEVKLRTIKKY
jgi:hypothetical protein